MLKMVDGTICWDLILRWAEPIGEKVAAVLLDLYTGDIPETDKTVALPLNWHEQYGTVMTSRRRLQKLNDDRPYDHTRWVQSIRKVEVEGAPPSALYCHDSWLRDGCESIQQ